MGLISFPPIEKATLSVAFFFLCVSTRDLLAYPPVELGGSAILTGAGVGVGRSPVDACGPGVGVGSATVSAGVAVASGPAGAAVG